MVGNECSVVVSRRCVVDHRCCWVRSGWCCVVDDVVVVAVSPTPDGAAERDSRRVLHRRRRWSREGPPGALCALT